MAVSLLVYLLKASCADGKDTASVRHQLYKCNGGATRSELQILIIGYFHAAIVLGGRAKLSRRTSSFGESFVWRWAWTCSAEHGGEVARHGQVDETRRRVRHAVTSSRSPRWVF